MQGFMDLADVAWDASSMTYSGKAKVIGGEPFVISIAANGYTIIAADASAGKVTTSTTPQGLIRVTLETEENTEVTWSMRWKK